MQRAKLLMATGVAMLSLLIFLSSPGLGQTMDSAWPMFMRDLHHTGLSPNAGPDNPNLLWSFTAAGAVQSCPVLDKDGNIYVGCGSMSGGTHFYSFDPHGNLRWSYVAADAFWSSPAISEDGVVYVGCWDWRVYAFDAGTGDTLWTFLTDNKVYSKPTIAPDGTIYVGSNDSLFYALNPDGSVRGSYHTGGWVYESSAAIDDDGYVYVGSYSDSLYCFDPDLNRMWARYIGGNTAASPSIGADGTIYIGSFDDNLYAFQPDGTLKWTYATGGNVNSTTGMGEDGTLYTGSTDDKLHAVNPETGDSIWTYLTGSNINTSPIIDANGTIYVGSSDDMLHAVNPDGTVKWTFLTGNNVVSTPAPGESKVLYFGSQDGNFYALGPKVAVFATTEGPTVPQGGVLETSIQLLNNTAEWQTFYLAAWVTVPGLGERMVLKPTELKIMPKGTMTGIIAHDVPPVAPVGSYVYTAKIGTSLEDMWDHDSFDFEVVEGAKTGTTGWQVVEFTIEGKNMLSRLAADLPTKFTGLSNSPNPFNVSSVISYDLETSGRVTIEVYDLLGRKVTTLVDGRQEAGVHSVNWDASELASGVYFYKLTAGDFTETKRTTLLK
jgi:outer membrane protein assembly factor BamB